MKNRLNLFPTLIAFFLSIQPFLAQEDKKNHNFLSILDHFQKTFFHSYLPSMYEN